MSKAHKGSTLILDKGIPIVDKNTVFLAHYDITDNDVLKGIEPQGDTVATLVNYDGYFGGGIAIEEGTINLYSENVRLGGDLSNNTNNWQNNWGTTISRTTDYAYSGSGSIRAITQGVNSDEGASAQHTALPSTTYSFSGWVMTTDSDVSVVPMLVQGNVGNIVGGTSVTLIPNRWTYLSITGTTPSTFNGTLQGKITTKTAKACTLYYDNFQMERKNFPTSFVNGERKAGFLKYPKEIINVEEGTISFWLKPKWETSQPCPIYSSGIDGGFDLLIKDANEQPYLRAYASSSASTQLRPSKIPFREWTHIAIVWKRNKYFGLYKNGNLDVYTETPFDWGNYYISNGNGFYLGSGIRQNSNIIIDELRIDKIMRTSEEIEKWYTSNVPFYPKGIYRLAY